MNLATGVKCGHSRQNYWGVYFWKCYWLNEILKEKLLKPILFYDKLSTNRFYVIIWKLLYSETKLVLKNNFLNFLISIFI